MYEPCFGLAIQYHINTGSAKNHWPCVHKLYAIAEKQDFKEKAYQRWRRLINDKKGLVDLYGKLVGMDCHFVFGWKDLEEGDLYKGTGVLVRYFGRKKASLEDKAFAAFLAVRQNYQEMTHRRYKERNNS